MSSATTPGSFACSCICRGRLLVILLHGCTRNAAAFAGDTGWTDLADRPGFPLILPDQPETNMPGHCFDGNVSPIRPATPARLAPLPA
jgi:poly(3-hydroxybutyrate) depolymerase